MSDRNDRVVIRPGFLKWSVVVFVLLLPFVGYTVWDYIEAARLDRVLHELDPQNGFVGSPGVRLDPNEAWAERYYRAGATLTSSYMPFLPGIQARLNRLSTAARTDDWPPAILTDLRDNDRENVEGLEFATKAAALPFKGFSPGTAFNYQLAGLFNLRQLLGYRAMLRVLDGDQNGAIEALFVEARLARTFDDGSTSFANWTGRDVIPVLERNHASADALAPLAQAIGDVDSAYDQAIGRNYAGMARRLIADSGLYSISPSPWHHLLVQPWTSHGLTRRLAFIARMIPAERAPWPQRIDQLIALGNPLWAIPKNLTEREYVENSVWYATSNIASFRCVRVAIAAEQYKRGRGELPSSQDVLVPKYLPAGVVDPFSGKSLLLKKNDDGYTVYSVGVNRTDDGGAISEEPNLIFAKENPADVGVRIRYR
jgi:hypothetical protein